MRKHALFMILCCAIPLILILALSAMGVLGSWGFYALILLCPFLHLVLMRSKHEPSEPDEK